MTGKTNIFRLGAVVALLVATAPAMAWGPRAQRTITGMAIQVIQHKYPDTFRPGDASYEMDVLRGAEAGPAVIAESLPINSEAEAIQAIAIQIQLLRDLRPSGAGSYFAYRMGVLSALISDVLLPYGLAFTPEEKALQAKIQNDIEEHLTQYGYTNPSRARKTISDVNQHFRAQQSFYGDNRVLIADDYRRGAGYNGFLKESSQSYFAKAVESTADAWFTIVSPTELVTNAPVTDSLKQRYYVDEIGYLLGEKANFHQAGLVYENLAALQPTDSAIYEEVADHYYAFGTRASIERSVKEWRNAYDIGGPNRGRVASKLAQHYLKEGRAFLDEAKEKGKGEAELPSALSAFQMAMRFDRTSDVAADLIQETNRQKKERDERRNMIVKIIASAESTREEAENQATGGSFGNAITSYRRSLELLAGVDDEFTDQFKLAEEMKLAVARSVASTIANVLEQASGAIQEGERLEETHKYDDAINVYERVPNIVGVIPDDHTRTALQDKQDIILLAESKIDKARTSKVAYEQQMANPAAARAPGAPAATAAPRPALGAAAIDDNDDDDGGNPRRR